MLMFHRTILKPALTASAAMLLTGAIAAAPAQARTLTYAAANPPTDTGTNRAIRWWADALNACTDGSLEVKFYFMGSLLKLKDAVDGISAGVADMGYVVPAYSQSKMPLWSLAGSLVGPGDEYVVTEAFARVRQRFPEIAQEEEKNNMKHIAHYSIGAPVMLSKKKPYLTPEHFGGDKVRLPSFHARAAKIENWRVTPVGLTFPEVYSAMGRGTIDGTVSYMTLVDTYKHNEVADHLVVPGRGQHTNVVVMNRRVWDSLSQKEQGCIDRLQPELMQRLARGNVEDTQAARELLANHPKHPLKIHMLDKTQQAAWEKGWKKADAERLEKVAEHSPAAHRINAAYLAEMDKVQEEVATKGYPWARK
jgi:TRAP-type C4-dicarboxylate transport system substrate-binding protein